MSLSRDLVRALAYIRDRAPPGDVADAAILHLRDAIGVGLAAAGSPVGVPYARMADQAVAGRATMLGQATSAPAEMAALVNGGLIHSLEYDDTHTASIVHGSSLAAAVSLAVAEEVGADGAAVLRSFVAAWEFMIRAGLAAPGGFQTRGFHITSVAGTLAAALVASDLMGLSEDETVMAIGISLSQASGVFEFLSNGSSVKSLHPGWAAHSGIMAAKLAGAGMSGPETALEGRWGLFRHFGGSEEAAARFRGSLGDLGTRWHLLDAAFKLHPCCHFLHPFIEAAGELGAAGVRPADVEAIVCLVPPGAAPIICEPWDGKQMPRDGHAMRWSLPLAIAIQMLEGEVSLDTFESPPSREALAFARRIAWEPLPHARFPEFFEAELRCRLVGGETRRARVEDAYGNRSRPASRERLDEKFYRNASRALPPDVVRHLDAALSELPAGRDLSRLTAALRSLAFQDAAQ